MSDRAPGQHEAQISDQGVPRPDEPPDCPPGWTVAPPDFVGVGFQRCGTTRWFDLITSHPEVAAPVATRKELHYFDRFFGEEFGSADRRRYADYFPRPPGSVTGEWTPTYATDFWIPALLAEAAPSARILVLVRDPIERYRSGMQRQHRVAKASQTPLQYISITDSFVRGLYHDQLTRLLAHFDRAQVLVLQYERCVQEPRHELRRTFEFLGLDDRPGAVDVSIHPNTQHAKPRLPGRARTALVDAYREDVARLLDLFPELERELWPDFAHV